MTRAVHPSGSLSKPSAGLCRNGLSIGLALSQLSDP
jgi:hypothetical protein